jgi:hypothetical protein
MTTLYDTIRSSYGHKNSMKKLAKSGYIRDNELSNHNQSVYYSPREKKMIYSIAGTHNLRDVGTDIWLGLGGIKNTNRYKEAEKNLNKSRDKYKDAHTTIIGHSLGGTIGSYLGSKGRGDNVISLDKGATIGQKTRNLEKSYRTKGDLVSMFSANAKHNTNLKNPNIKTGILPIDGLLSHNVSNIKNSGIIV